MPRELTWAARFWAARFEVDSSRFPPLFGVSGEPSPSGDVWEATSGVDPWICIFWDGWCCECAECCDAIFGTPGVGCWWLTPTPDIAGSIFKFSSCEVTEPAWPGGFWGTGFEVESPACILWRRCARKAAKANVSRFIRNAAHSWTRVKQLRGSVAWTDLAQLHWCPAGHPIPLLVSVDYSPLLGMKTAVPAFACWKDVGEAGVELVQELAA